MQGIFQGVVRAKTTRSLGDLQTYIVVETEDNMLVHQWPIDEAAVRRLTYGKPHYRRPFGVPY